MIVTLPALLAVNLTDWVSLSTQTLPPPLNTLLFDEEAYYIDKLHSEGKDDLLPYKGMLLTTMVAGAKRKIRLKDWPEFIQIPISAVRIGKIGLLGIPGEPFAAVGLGIKKSKGYDVILPCCLVNGSVGYFPMKDSYEEGGYEANTSQFKGGSAEIIVEESKKILENL